jgi:hypothetical protein
MQRRGIWSLRIAAIVKKIVFVAALAALGFGGFLYYKSTRPALPETGADWVAQQYLQCLQMQDYQTAYALASRGAQEQTTPGQMQETCKEVYSSIDGWEFGPPKYAFTHASARVPVRLAYRAAWSAQETSTMEGNLDFKLENGEWRLVAAVPFATAIMKQRDEQHMAGSRQQ